ncbi:MAG: DUF72 domain-containing protein [Chlorobiaceae bacterium]|nr:DUF72 domain-containing protein [Chlorobiaceae bacterium]MBA4310888.1 DUF72 domain-containing protein [Chlorobiaceae bacterium]
MNNNFHQIRIGTCSWKYESWQGLIYSNSKEINYLSEYSSQFNTVEIDQWFWSLHSKDKITLPKQKDVETYFNSVPEDFKFTIKIPNSITLTHFYKDSKNEKHISNPNFLSPELYELFLEKISLMKKKVGMLMFQFEYLNKDKMSSQLEFIDRFENFLTQINRELEIGIEIRNPNYLNQNYFEFLKRNNVHHVYLQGYYMPSIFDVGKEQIKFLTDFAVIRLHGTDRNKIEELTNNNWNKIVVPRDEELSRVAKMIKYFFAKKVNLYVNVNNHYEGSAPLTINKIKKLLTAE